MKKIVVFLLLLLGFHLLILSKLQFTAWPEMISFPYLINHGFVTYKDMVHAYPPLLVNILAASFKLFGYELIVLKNIGWIAILSCDVFIFLILRNLTKKSGVAIAGTFIYVILQSILEGNMVWPDLFIVPFLLLTFLLLINKKYFWSGIAIGLALLTKQTAIFYVAYIMLFIIFYERDFRRLITFITGGLLVGTPFLLNLIDQKSLMDFVNWAIIYPSKYWTKFPGYIQLSPTIRENLILLVLFIPLTFLVFKAKKKIFSDNYFLLLFGFFICGVIGVYPRFSFFHFQPALAFLIILYFYLSKNKYIFLIPVVLIIILQHNQIKFSEARFWTSRDLELGSVIEKSTPSDKPIYLLGLPSNFYVFSNRLPNTQWFDGFGWYLEIPGVQEKIIKDFDQNQPSTIYWEAPLQGNWYDIGVYQPQMITDWIKKNYNMKREVQKGLSEWELKK